MQAVHALTPLPLMRLKSTRRTAPSILPRPSSQRHTHNTRKHSTHTNPPPPTAPTTRPPAQALAAYESVVDRYPRLALTEYARIGRALQLWQAGDTRHALIALEDEEIEVRCLLLGLCVHGSVDCC